jgi:hypothetical protein
MEWCNLRCYNVRMPEKPARRDKGSDNMNTTTHTEKFRKLEQVALRLLDLHRSGGAPEECKELDEALSECLQNVETPIPPKTHLRLVVLQKRREKLLAQCLVSLHHDLWRHVVHFVREMRRRHESCKKNDSTTHDTGSPESPDTAATTATTATTATIKNEINDTTLTDFYTIMQHRMKNCRLLAEFDFKCREEGLHLL